MLINCVRRADGLREQISKRTTIKKFNISCLRQEIICKYCNKLWADSHAASAFTAPHPEYKK